MVTIYFTRHGQTDMNIQERIQGRLEVDLNTEGLKQAKELNKKISDIKIDHIFSSPLKRAIDTALIAKGDREIPFTIDDRLIEESYGDMEGVKREGDVYYNQRNSFFKRYPNGESYLDVCQRIYNFIDDIKDKYDGKTVLVVAHGGLSRVFNSYFYDMTNEEFINFKVKNCELVKYEI